MKIELKYEWEPVEQNENNNYIFPELATKHMRDRLNKPAIYCWEFQINDKIKKIYIGQTDELVTKRLYQYRKPGKGQATNKRINYEIKKWQEQHKNESVVFKFLSLSEVRMNGSPIDIANKMKSKNFREMIESIIIEELRLDNQDNYFLNALD